MSFFEKIKKVWEFKQKETTQITSSCEDYDFPDNNNTLKDFYDSCVTMRDSLVKLSPRKQSVEEVEDSIVDLHMKKLFRNMGMKNFGGKNPSCGFEVSCGGWSHFCRVGAME